MTVVGIKPSIISDNEKAGEDENVDNSGTRTIRTLFLVILLIILFLYVNHSMKSSFEHSEINQWDVFWIFLISFLCYGMYVT